MAPAASSAVAAIRRELVRLIETPPHSGASSWARYGLVIVGDPIIVAAYESAVTGQHFDLNRPQTFGMGSYGFAVEVRGIPRDQQQVSAHRGLRRYPALEHQTVSSE